MKVELYTTFSNIKYYGSNDFHFFILPSIELEKFIHLYCLNINWLFFGIYINLGKEE